MSAPLHELAAEAPAVSPIFQPDRVAFPFSNDDSNGSFEVALARTRTAEYRAVQNRVAVLIGESALTTNIQHIPEETIILLDNSEPMVQHMGDYTEALRTAASANAWLQQTGIDNGVLSPKAQEIYSILLGSQVAWYASKSTPHALTSPKTFEASQKLAREKAIIPWRGDVTSEKDMTALGNALRKVDAIVTLLNLTNVIPFTARRPERKSFPTAAGYADVLEHLPTTPEMPILTTSDITIRGVMVEATGPFFGLDHLRADGGDSKYGSAAAGAHGVAELTNDLIADLLNALGYDQ